jgi:dipeptidase D
MTAVDFPIHPKMELVFTIDEEAGMSGILWLDFSLLSGTKIINIDSEDEDEICISSAWWIGILWSKDLEFTEWKYPKYSLELFWMKWWHSGIEIDKNRGNAIIVLLDFLVKYENTLELYDIKSGVASNVIPSKLNCIIGISDLEDFKNEFSKHLELTKNTFDCPEISFKLTENDKNIKVIENWIETLKELAKIKDWVYSMSQNIEDLVQTSTNFWIIKIEDSKLKNVYLSRSSDNEELKMIIAQNSQYLKEKWFEIDYDRWYPGWQDNPNSLLVQIAKEEWEKALGKTPHIRAIHAWLECWALVWWLNNPNVNAISIGPNIEFVHSTEERVDLESVKKVEKILEWILKRI